MLLSTFDGSNCVENPEIFPSILARSAFFTLGSVTLVGISIVTDVSFSDVILSLISLSSLSMSTAIPVLSSVTDMLPPFKVIDAFFTDIFKSFEILFSNDFIGSAL